jgi:hypothetical protein
MRRQAACSGTGNEPRSPRDEPGRTRADDPGDWRRMGRLVHRIAGIASEAACKPSSVPRLAPRRRSSIWGRRLPDGSCSRPEGWAARLSPRRTGVAPSYLALLRVEFAAFHSGPGGPASSLWHWSSPHGGRALPATLRWGARTFLTPSGCPADARPSGRLAGVSILPGNVADPNRGRSHPRPAYRRPRTTSATARPRIPWDTALRCTPSSGSPLTSADASRNATPRISATAA